MKKYIIICHDHIIKQGQCALWEKVDALMPIGYKQVWGFNCLHLLLINVQPTMQIVTKTKKEITDMIEWHKMETEQYRMAM